MLAVISACPLVLALLGVLSILPFFSLMNFLPVSLIIVSFVLSYVASNAFD